MPVAKKFFLSKYYSGMLLVPKRTPGTPTEIEEDEEEHDNKPLKSNTPLENADDPSLVRTFFFFFWKVTVVFFSFLSVFGRVSHLIVCRSNREIFLLLIFMELTRPLNLQC
jgi:hypothetical protein